MKPSRTLHFVQRPLFVGLTLAMCALAGESVAADPAQKAAAESLFQDAKRLMAEKKYTEACPKFASSQKLDPGIGTMLYLADCYEKEGKTASAWAQFLEASSLAKKASDTREAVATERAAKLTPNLMRVSIDVPESHRVEGLTIRIDSVNIDAAVWGSPIPSDPGDHVVEAIAPGKKPWTTKISLVSVGKSLPVPVPKLEDDDRPKPAASTSTTATGVATVFVAPPPPPPSGAGMRVAGLVITGVGAVGLVTGGVLGAAARSRWNGAKDLCPNAVCSTQTAFDDSQTAKKLANYATVGFIVGGVGVAAGLLIFGLAPRNRTDSAKDTAGISKPYIVPALGPDGGGFVLGGAF